MIHNAIVRQAVFSTKFLDDNVDPALDVLARSDVRSRSARCAEVEGCASAIARPAANAACERRTDAGVAPRQPRDESGSAYSTKFSPEFRSYTSSRKSPKPRPIRCWRRSTRFGDLSLNRQAADRELHRISASGRSCCAADLPIGPRLWRMTPLLKRNLISFPGRLHRARVWPRR